MRIHARWYHSWFENPGIGFGRGELCNCLYQFDRLINTLQGNNVQSGNFNQGKQIHNRTFILSGPIGSGKTTSLLQWSKGRQDIHGILSPVVNGERVFMNIAKKASFPMEAGENEQRIRIGRYNFSKRSFEKASRIIEDGINKVG